MSLEAGARPQNFASGILKPKAATGRNQEFQLLCPQWAKIFLPCLLFHPGKKKKTRTKTTKNPNPNPNPKQKKPNPKTSHKVLQVIFSCYLQCWRRLEEGRREAVIFMCPFMGSCLCYAHRYCNNAYFIFMPCKVSGVF